MANMVLLPKDVDVTHIEYGPVRNMESGSRSININYRSSPTHSHPLVIQTPRMECPFGFSSWSNKGDNGGAQVPEKFSLDVSFRGREARDALRTFEDMLRSFDSRLIDDCFANGEGLAWLKKKMPSKEVVVALYRPSCKDSKDPERYAPTFKMSLPCRDGKFGFSTFNSRREPINLMDVINSDQRGKGCSVQAIVQCGGVWLAGTNFGVSWKVKQLMITEAPSLNVFAFKTTEEDDDEDFTVEDETKDAAAASAAAAAPTRKEVGGGSGGGAAAGQMMLQSSDDEEEGNAQDMDDINLAFC